MRNDRDTINNRPIDPVAGDVAASPFDNQAAVSDTMSTWQFVEGTPVYDMSGDKIGTVSEHGVQDNCLVVHHGLFRKDVYVPLSAISNQDVNGVYLTISKDEALQGTGWDGAAGTTIGSAAATVDSVDDTANTAPAGPVDRGAADEVRVPVREEELVAGKRQNEVGRVHLHRDVVEEPQTVTDSVTSDKVRVERVPVQGDYGDNDGTDAFTEKDIDVPVMGEELITDKRATVKEEVRLSKQPVTEERQASDTVRKERVAVDGAEDLQSADRSS